MKLFSGFLFFVLLFPVQSSAQSWVKAGPLLKGDSGSWFGYSVSLNADGNILAVGSYNALDTNNIISGKVETFQWSGSEWLPIGQTIYGDPKKYKFGSTVKLSPRGDFMVVAGQDYLYLYHWDNGWVRYIVQYLYSDINCIDIEEDEGGNSIIVIGDQTYKENDDTKGRLLFFKWNGVGLTYTGSILGIYPDAALGHRVALSSNARVVAASSRNRQYVSLMYWDDVKWLNLGHFDFSGNTYSDPISLALGAEGFLIAIGFTNDKGAVQLYRYDGWTWNQVGSDLTDEFWFGNNVALDYSGERLLVSSRSYRKIYRVSSTSVSYLDLFLDPEPVGIGYSRVMEKSIDVSGDGMTVAAANYLDEEVQIYRYGWAASISDAAVTGPTIYPNPGTGMYEILNLIPGKSQLVVYNSLGQIVLTEGIEPESASFIIPGPAGFYRVKIVSGSTCRWNTVMKY